MKFRLGLDLDGVVDLHPDYLKWYSDHVLMSGGEVYIITGRRLDRDLDVTVNLLKRLKFRYTELVMYPFDYELSLPLPMETTQEIGRWKANVCEDYAINQFWDDSMHRYRTKFPCPTIHI